MSFIPTMLIAGTAFTMIGNGNVESNPGNLANQICNNQKSIVQQQNIENATDLKDFLNKKGICIQNDSANCNIGNHKPENCKPGILNPETNKPGVNKPGANNPGGGNIETEKPETGKPENGETTNNSYAAQVVNLVNKEREKAGLTPLVNNMDTADAALIRAKEIKQSFSHTRPDGKSFDTVLKESGVSFKSAGENIAWGQKTPEEVVNGWMNSEGHRANILSGNFTSIGVGHYESNGTSYWVQLFTS